MFLLEKYLKANVVTPLFKVIAGIPITLYFWPDMHLHLPPQLPHHWVHGHPTHRQACLQHPHSQNTKSGPWPSFKKGITSFCLPWLDHFPPGALFCICLSTLTGQETLCRGGLHVCMHTCACAGAQGARAGKLFWTLYAVHLHIPSSRRPQGWL